MTDEEKIMQDRDWSMRVAGIAIATLLVAKPQILSLSTEQVARCTEIFAEEIFIRLVMGDRPPA